MNHNSEMLTPEQAQAISHVREYARNRKESAVGLIEHVLRMSDISESKFQELISNVKSKARVALHFHPDRLDANLKSVAENLLGSGIYKSQFESLLSSGSVSAHPGGDRDLWEKYLFGGAYQQAGVENFHRPKYGALDFLAHPDGPSPRFGSCYFLLMPEVTKRCTFTYLDSYQDPKEKGTIDEFEDILSALMKDSFTDEVVLGEKLRPQKLLERLSDSSQKVFTDRLKAPHRRILDHYIEAQVHGHLSLEKDVEYLIADPSFQNTPTGNDLESLCEKYEIQLHWHAGYVLKTSKIPTDFRGPEMPSLGTRVAPDGLLTIKKIGDAASQLKREPELWADRGSVNFVLQELKLLWHVLLRYGEPF